MITYSSIELWHSLAAPLPFITNLGKS